MTSAIQIQERNWAMLSHLAALTGLVGIPFGNIIGPLIVWLIKKDEFPYVDEQAKESLNFQISMTIYSLISMMLIFIIIGIFCFFGLLIANLALVIIATVKANAGEHFHYPFSIKFI
ncbi:DUF4870 domain-containing protein [candidate division KSB1 bacterium]|nr:DUF4870 domain-containing protein [candidate division KSB1 bacterium]